MTRHPWSQRARVILGASLALWSLIAAILAGAAPADAQAFRGAPRPGLRPGVRVFCSPFTYPASPFYQNLTLAGRITAQATQNVNQLASPACTQSGATLTEDSTTNVHQSFSNNFSASTSKPYTFTAFAKQVVGTRNVQLFFYANDFGSGANVVVNPTTCAVVTAANVYGLWSSPSSTVGFVGDWCKITLTATVVADTNMPNAINMISGASNSYLGDGASTIGLWGLDIR